MMDSPALRGLRRRGRLGCMMFVFGVDSGRGVCLVDVDDAQGGVQVSVDEKEEFEDVQGEIGKPRDKRCCEEWEVCLWGVRGLG